MTVSYDEATVPKHTVYVPLLRVHWVGSANGMVCWKCTRRWSTISFRRPSSIWTTLAKNKAPRPVHGDMDGDGVVTVSDVLNVLSEFGCTAKCAMDINGDGATNVTDVLAVLSAFGTACN